MRDPEHQRSHAWLRLNADGVLIALLCVASAAAWFLDPECAVQPCAPGRFPLVGMFVNAGYLLCGLGILVALWQARADYEVWARAALVVVSITAAAREVVFGAPETLTLIVPLILLVSTGLRISSLIEGGTFVVPRWRSR